MAVEAEAEGVETPQGQALAPLGSPFFPLDNNKRVSLKSCKVLGYEAANLPSDILEHDAQPLHELHAPKTTLLRLLGTEPVKLEGLEIALFIIFLIFFQNFAGDFDHLNVYT